MPTANNHGVEIHYELDGAKHVEPVVLIEGLGYGRWMWRWQRSRLESDYRLVVPDNRGTGNSAAPEGPYTMEAMASDVEAVLADAGIGRAHLVGASMGGMIALQYALEYDRAESLTLLGSSPGGPEEEPIPEATRERIFASPEDADERETIRHRMEPAFSERFYQDRRDLVDRIVEWRVEQDAGEDARRAQAAAVEAFDVSDRLDEIELPTLVLHGTADGVVPVRNGRLLAEGLPHAEFVAIEGGSHLAFVEEPDLVTEHVRTFLDEHAFDVDQPGGGAGGPDTGVDRPQDGRSGGGGD